MSHPKDNEILSIKRLMHDTEKVIQHLHDDILRKTVRKHEATQTLEKLRSMLATAEQERDNEMQSVQTEHESSGQHSGGGERDLPSEVSQADEDKS
jgi:hypothetical protein